jgi:hypothetical protein
MASTLIVPIKIAKQFFIAVLQVAYVYSRMRAGSEAFSPTQAQ